MTLPVMDYLGQSRRDDVIGFTRPPWRTTQPERVVVAVLAGDPT
jgi:hypothetical protein